MWSAWVEFRCLISHIRLDVDGGAWIYIPGSIGFSLYKTMRVSPSSSLLENRATSRGDQAKVQLVEIKL